jgi:bleomycin hydrolase
MKINNLLKLAFFAGIVLISNTMRAQKTISDKELQQIKKSYDANSSYIKAVTNAVSNNDIKDLALNRKNVSIADGDFKYKVDVRGITNQESSGRCWMFTGLNVLRPKVQDNFKINEFYFSHNYLYFWDILEKSNLFLEQIIATADKDIMSREVNHFFKNPVNDGGVWNSLANVISKYGAVPKSVMPETHSSNNTSMMIRLINRKLREDGLQLREAQNKGNKGVRNMKIKMLGDIYKILAINLGEPPTKFKWRFTDKEGNLGEYKEYTPKSFFEQSVPGFNQDDYVMLMNDPTREYYKLYEIDMDRNVQEGQNWKYINLPSDEIKKFAIESIKANDAMYASCDVGKQLEKKSGVLDPNNFDYESLFDVKFGMDKKQRILTGESGSSHGMALVAVDVDKDGKPTKWMFENSWGGSYGHNGYLIFTDDWFNEYMFRVVVLKKYIDAKTLKILDQKPTMLPAWDPMFSADE